MGVVEDARDRNNWRWHVHLSILSRGIQEKEMRNVKKQWKDASDRNNRRLLYHANPNSIKPAAAAGASHLHRSSLGRLSSATWRSRSQYSPGRPFPLKYPPSLLRRVELQTHVVVLPSAPHQCTQENTHWASTLPQCSVCARSLWTCRVLR